MSDSAKTGMATSSYTSDVRSPLVPYLDKDRGVEKMREKLILSAIITMIFQLQLALKSETQSPKMSEIQQIPTHEMITEIARENLDDLLRWLRQKQTRLN